MLDKEKAKFEIKKLIEKYNVYKEDDKIIGNEKQICDSLIRPFFRDVLGWNIEDPYEFKSEYNQAGKRIDYLVCIEDVSQFVVEAKAPTVDINNTQFYRQAVQYAEGRGRKLAILTNFKEFIILRAGIENESRFFRNEIKKINLLNLSETDIEFLLYFEKKFWIEKGDENPLYSLKNLKEKRPLDEILVEDMSKWRAHLLISLKAMSKGKYNFENEKDLEYIEEEVQRFVDRLIFICYCEDKQLSDNELKPILHEYREKHIGKKVFIVNKIKLLFEKYFNVYNSDLFKNGLCDEFEFDDSILAEILEDLRGYYGDALPYDFSVIDADILGRAYENFLGHIITGKKRFKEKKDKGKRKKMGIYYTPQYIVNYIIKNTLREKIKNMSFEEILKIKVLDPACGSGSFLIKAFDVLVEESKRALKQEELNYEQKRNLMLNCIHGVDLDERACDIAKLNLSLKLATRREKLPELHNNIQNGNSLIDDPKVAGDKAFEWNKRFPFKFDIVIGNPPYVFARSKSFSEDEKKYYYKNYKLTQYQLNTYLLFNELGINLLTDGGIFGFIIPNTWQTIDNFSKFRKYLFSNMSNIIVVNIEDKVFEEANVDTAILIFEKFNQNRRIKLMVMRDGKGSEIFEGNPDIFGENYILGFSKVKLEESYVILKKIQERSIFLIDIAIVKAGLKAYETGKGKPKQTEEMKNNRIYHSKNKKDNNYLKYLEGRDVQRYYLNWSGNFLKYGKCLAAPRKFDLFNTKRILVRQIPSKPPYSINAILLEDVYLNDINSMIIYKLKERDYKFLLGILNSKLISFWFNIKFNKLQRGLFPQFKVKELKQFPIIKEIDKIKEKRLILLVDKILELQKQYHNDKILRKDKIKEEIDKINNEIDQEVYKLYGITKEEQKIIEESLR